MGATDPPQSTLAELSPTGLEIGTGLNPSVDASDNDGGDGSVRAVGEHALVAEAEVKELIERHARESAKMENASQQSPSKRHPQRNRQDLLDKVETLTGEISESLLALTAKEKDNTIPEKDSRRPQNTAGPQSAYLKPALSPINEDGPLEEASNAYDSPYTHGILLPDWQIWAEQVSQLLNRFSSEISILTSRVEWIDQKLRSPDGEVLIQGQSERQLEESEDLGNSKLEEANSPSGQQGVGGITAEIPSSPLVPLTPNMRLRTTDATSPPSSNSAPRRSTEGVAVDVELDLADKIEVAYVTCLQKHIPYPMCWKAVETREREEEQQDTSSAPEAASLDDSNSEARTPRPFRGFWEAVEGVPSLTVPEVLASAREPSSARSARSEVLPEPPQLPAPRVLDRESLGQLRTNAALSASTNGVANATALFPEPAFGMGAKTPLPRTSGPTTGHVSPLVPAQGVAMLGGVTTTITPMLEQRPVVRLRLPAGTTASTSARAMPQSYPNCVTQVQGGQ